MKGKKRMRNVKSIVLPYSFYLNYLFLLSYCCVKEFFSLRSCFARGLKISSLGISLEAVGGFYSEMFRVISRITRYQAPINVLGRCECSIFGRRLFVINPFQGEYRRCESEEKIFVIQEYLPSIVYFSGSLTIEDFSK